MPESDIHIMQVLHTLEVGGAEKLAYDISNSFDKSFQFSFFCLDALGYLSNLIKQEGGNVYCFGRKDGWDFGLIKEFAELLTAKKVDIVHAHQYTPYFYAVLASFFSKRHPKVIFTEHGRHQPDKVRWKRVVFNKIFQHLTAAYTGVARFSKDCLVEFEKIPENKIDVIYNGIDLERFPKTFDKDKIRKSLGFEADKTLVGIIARLDPIKNHSVLIEAISLLKNQFPDIQLIVVGEGPMLQELKNLVSTLAIDDTVIFTGLRKDVPRILMALDIFVLPSSTEAMSVTLLEAMSASLPVVATDVGGNQEVVIPHITGELVQPKDPHQLADAIESIISAPQKAEQMGKAGRERVEDMFTFDRMIEQYKKLYLKITGKQKL